MLLIDGDVLVYRVAFAAQTTVYSVYLDGELMAPRLEGKTAVNEFLKFMELTQDEVQLTSIIETDPIENALHSVISMLESMMKKMNEYGYRIFLSGDNNFRADVYPAYKAGRKPKPVLYEQIRQYLQEFWNAEVVHGMEADDAMAMNQTDTSIICTIDKDLLMVPGKHYNFVTDVYQEVTEAEGTRNFYSQLLSGDSVDNICGIRGVGKKTADKILEKANWDWGAVLDEYEKYWGDGWEEVLECNEQLIWMRRA